MSYYGIYLNFLTQNMPNDPIGMSKKWNSNYDSCLLYILYIHNTWEFRSI